MRIHIALVLATLACGGRSAAGPDGPCVRPPPPQGVAADHELATFAYDEGAPLDEELVPLFVDADSVRVYRVSYASPDGGRVPGLLWAPPGPGPFAGVVVQHGMPQRAEDMVYDAQAIARLGAVVIAIDAPFVRRGGPPRLYTRQDSVEQVQLIRDLRRAVDLLVSRPDVDAARLGYFGYSYGAAMGALVAGVERRLQSFVLAAGDGGLVSHMTGADDPPDARDRLPCEWLAAMTPIEPIRFVGRAAPAALLFQAGRYDQAVPPADAARVHEAASEPKELRWYDAGHELGYAAFAERLEWLRARLAAQHGPAVPPDPSR